ncbi:MAG: GDSL-type esterase/lipase family protein [Sandaracinus sp.]
MSGSRGRSWAWRALGAVLALGGASLVTHAPSRAAVAQQVEASVVPMTTSASEAATAIASESTSIELAPPAPVWPLDEDGHPIYGVDIDIEDPSGSALRAFHASLRRAATGEGQSRVVFYGASHVAADLYTGTVRRLLQSRFGDAGHGFVLPVEPWPSYRVSDLDVTSNYRRWDILRVRVGQTEPQLYGVMGVTLTTDAPHAWGRIDTEAQPASRFELWYAHRPDGGTIDLLVDGRLDRRLNTRADSTDAGYAVVTTEDRPHTFEIRTRGDGTVTVYGATVERERPGVIVDALGINGARAASQLLWNSDLQAEQLRRRMPDLVVLAYGTNESGDDDQPIDEYEHEVRAVLGRIQSAVPTASCLLVGPSDRPIVHRDGSFEPRPRTAQVVEAQRRVARDYGCGFFDLVRFGGGEGHMMEWAAADPPWAQSDHVHYTIRGYTRLGEVVANALVAGYEGPQAL